MCGGYSWGVVTLTHMYDQIGNVCFVQTKQLDDYVTLLQINDIHICIT